MSIATSRVIVDEVTLRNDAQHRDEWQRLVDAGGWQSFHCDPRWLTAVCKGLRYEPHVLIARRDGQLVGVLPLCLVKSWLFGRFLVSLPYVNSAGVVADDADVTRALIDRAVSLTHALNARYLELRHETEFDHVALTETMTSKVHMRLDLPETTGEFWNERLKSKRRSQIRNGENRGLAIHWGRLDLLNGFYSVFARNMRDLGTPVYPRRLFHSILTQFDDEAELCVVRSEGRPIAAALLVHGNGTTEVPSASSLRKYNHTSANMVMYWHLLKRTIERGNRTFDFGRSTRDCSTCKFKKQWGAQEHPAIWQYHLREGTIGDARPDNPKYRLMIKTWQKLPVWLTRVIGPPIVRGIP